MQLNCFTSSVSCMYCASCWQGLKAQRSFEEPAGKPVRVQEGVSPIMYMKQGRKRKVCQVKLGYLLLLLLVL
jgi:hypothetical protein